MPKELGRRPEDVILDSGGGRQFAVARCRLEAQDRNVADDDALQFCVFQSGAAKVGFLRIGAAQIRLAEVGVA